MKKLDQILMKNDGRKINFTIIILFLLIQNSFCQSIDSIEYIINNHHQDKLKFVVVEKVVKQQGIIKLIVNNNELIIPGEKSVIVFENQFISMPKDSYKTKLISNLNSYLSLHNYTEMKLSSQKEKVIFKSPKYNYVEIYFPLELNQNLKVIVFEENPELNTLSYFKNPSFEGEPSPQHIYKSNLLLDGWTDCGSYNNFKNHSPPDLHSSETDLWNVNSKPSDGKTFIGLVAREDGSWESISQNLVQPFKKDSCYHFSIDIKTSIRYLSSTSQNRNEIKNFNEPTFLVISLSNAFCMEEEVIFRKKIFNQFNWTTLNVDFIPNNEYTFLTIALENINSEKYVNSHLLIDNIHDFEIRKCQN